MAENVFSGRIAEAAPLVIATSGTHTVQLYEEDAFLVEVLTRVVREGLVSGDSVVTLLTPDHQSALDASLAYDGVDVAAARDGERWIALDAVRTLESLSRDGVVDEGRLTPTVGASIDLAAKTTLGGRVRLFGEMVNLLWRRNDRETALRFEALWEAERVRRSRFSVMCAYPLRDFGAAADTREFDAVCRQHTHVVPAESYAMLDSAGARLRQVAALQQKAFVFHDRLESADEFVVEVECTLCRSALLLSSEIGEAESELLADHLRRIHPGTLGAGKAMLGQILRPMLVTRRRR